jgi:dihydrodipicolinate synthase/N-acetylneuraminate lyase
MLYTFLSLGADGALVAQFQLFPHLVKGVFESYSKGDLKKTLDFHEKSMELYNIINKYFGNANLAAQCKAIWRLRGVDMEFAVRHPHFPVTQEQLDRAEPEFMKLGLQKIH